MLELSVYLQHMVHAEQRSCVAAAVAQGQPEDSLSDTDYEHEHHMTSLPKVSAEERWRKERTGELETMRVELVGKR